jgi:hypothetical protein
MADNIFIITACAGLLLGTIVRVCLHKSPRANVFATFVFLITLGTGPVWNLWFKPNANPKDPNNNDVVETSNPIEDSRPIEVLGAGYVSSNACKECHPQQHSSWSHSYHRTMTQFATPEVITADMDNTEVKVAGHHYRFSHRGETCWVELDDPDDSDKRIERPIVMTTGSHHMQVYWYPAGGSRALGQVPLVFLHEIQRWIPRDSAFLVPPDAPPGSETARWNETCIACHTTHPQSRPLGEQEWDSHVAEMGISCEACHGPGDAHIQWRRNQTLIDLDSETVDDPMKSPAHMPHTRGSEVCGQCHGITTARNPTELQVAKARGYSYRPGDDLAKSRVVVRNTRASLAHIARYLGAEAVDSYMRDRFWSDGMVRISGREFNGLIDSPCFQRGKLSCISCHAMHMAEDDPRDVDDWANDMLHPGMTGNRACLQCHKTGNYGPNHTHHEASSSGSVCYNCHMPHTTYGLLKAIRSHQISSPNAGSRIATGRPLACNLCHLDRTLQWSADHLEEWFDIKPPKFTADQKTVADSILLSMTGDAGQRALAAWHMGWKDAQAASGDNWQAPFLAYLLDDPYDAVRFIAQRSLQTLPGFADFKRETKYDFVLKPSARPIFRDRIHSIWRSQYKQGAVQTEQLLINHANGTLNSDKIERLYRERDDRRINLVE